MEALAILEKKKGGKYCVLQMDPEYEPPAMETRTLYGLQLEQMRNNCVINSEMFTNIVSDHKTVSTFSNHKTVSTFRAFFYLCSNFC